MTLWEKCSREEEAYLSVKNCFGNKWFMQEEIQKNLASWNNLARLLKAENYEDVIINREIFLNILKSNEFSYQLNNLISNIYGVSLEEIDYEHILRMMDEILTTSGLIHKIEYSNNEIIIYHKFDNEKIIKTINETILRTLKISSQIFNIKKNSKITKLNRVT
ncbi:MAG: hypothetical protein WA130_14485 [Candidatus Methanoperedens sp.]